MMKNSIYLLMLVFLVSCTDHVPEKTGLEGKSLPAFNLLLIDSVTYFNTSSIPEGRPIVLFYFGPTCPYSRAQMEEIIEDMNQLKEIRFILFSTWPFNQTKEFYAHYQLNKYQNIITGVDYTNFFSRYFNAQGVPYLAIFGRDKKLNKAFIGKVYGRQIKEISEY